MSLLLTRGDLGSDLIDALPHARETGAYRF
jgi:hypothetical protein